MRVDFSGMNARWRLSGPELIFFNAELARGGARETFLAADEVSIGVGLLRLLRDRELVVDRILIRETDIDLRQDDAGGWLLQGTPLDAVFAAGDAAPGKAGPMEVIGQDIHVAYEHPGSGQLQRLPGPGSGDRTASIETCRVGGD